VNGRSLAKIEITNFNLGFDTSKISITLGGGLLAAIADIFIGLFKGSIIRSIGSEINLKAPPAINAAIQNSILYYNGIQPIYGDWAMDTQFPVAPVVTPNTIGIYLNATIINATSGYRVPNTPIQDILVDMTSTNQFMISVSRYSVDSVILTLFNGGWLGITFTPELVGPQGSLLLNTTYLDTILPGIAQRFGKDQPVTIHASNYLPP